MSKKESVKEIAKKEIIVILKNGAEFNAAGFHAELEIAGIKTSLDTVRKSISELVTEKIIEKFEIDGKKGFWFKTAPVVKKRGWKTKLIKKVFAQKGGQISRTNLAAMINSDERNTHILISCIKKSTDFGTQIISWDKKKKVYNY